MGIHTQPVVAEWVELLTGERDLCVGRGTGMPLCAVRGRRLHCADWTEIQRFAKATDRR
jgi:hypothetical protein